MNSGCSLQSDTLWAHALMDARRYSKIQKKLMVCRFWRVKTGRFSVITRLLSKELILHIPVIKMQPMSHACVCWNYKLIHPQSHKQLLTDTGHVFMLARRTADTQEVRCNSTNHPERWDSQQTMSHWKQRHVTVRTMPQTDHDHDHCDWHRLHNMQHCKGVFFNNNVKPLRTHKHHLKQHINKQPWIKTLPELF